MSDAQASATTQPLMASTAPAVQNQQKTLQDTDIAQEDQFSKLLPVELSLTDTITENLDVVAVLPVENLSAITPEQATTETEGGNILPLALPQTEQTVKQIDNQESKLAGKVSLHGAQSQGLATEIVQQTGNTEGDDTAHQEFQNKQAVDLRKTEQTDIPVDKSATEIKDKTPKNLQANTVSIQATPNGVALTQSVVTENVSGVKTTVYIGPAVNHADWGSAFASRVAWQIGDGVQQAQIKVNPAELGPVEIRISIDKDTGSASVQFLANHGSTREAIEQSLPRLRELLQESGLNLADTNVSQHPQEQSDTDSGFSQNDNPDSWGPEQSEIDNGSVDTEMSVVSVSEGLIDLHV